MNFNIVFNTRWNDCRTWTIFCGDYIFHICEMKVLLYLFRTLPNILDNYEEVKLNFIIDLKTLLVALK